MSIRVLVADDHAIIRQGLQLLLRGASDIELVGEADSGERAVRLAEELRPDVIVMDIGMPGMDGFEATRLIREQDPDSRVIALSMHNDGAFMEGMREAGASGYVLKDEAFEELLKAIRRVSAGGSYFSA